MAVLLSFDDYVLRLICGYALHSGRNMEEKHSFYDELKGEWGVHSADDLVMCLCDFSRCVDLHIYGFNGVDERHILCQSIVDGRMLLEFCL